MEKLPEKIPTLNMKERRNKIMKAQYRKEKRKLNKRHGITKNNKNSATTDISLNFKKVTDSSSPSKSYFSTQSKVNVLTEELFLMKQSEKTLKHENTELENSLKKCTEDTDLKQGIITRLKKEQGVLVSKIKTGQDEISNLNRVIKEKDKVQFDLKQLVEKQKDGEFNPNEIKIKQLNIQLRQQRLVARNLRCELKTCQKLLEEKRTENFNKQNDGRLESMIKFFSKCRVKSTF